MSVTSFSDIFEEYYKCIPMLQYEDSQYYRDCINKEVTWISPKNYLLPFQVSRAKKPFTTLTLKLRDMNGNDTDLTASLDEGQLQVFTGFGKDIIQFFGTQELTLDCGLFYYVLSDGVETWFSEVFNIVDFEFTIDKELAITSDTAIAVGEPNIDVIGGASGGFVAQERLIYPVTL